MHDAESIIIVIPAKAGIHWLLVGRKMDPRFRGDDASFADAIADFGNPKSAHIGRCRMHADRLGRMHADRLDAPVI